MSRSHDVVIFHAGDTSPWCKYLEDLFKTNKNIRTKHMNLDEKDYENDPELTAAVKDTFLIVLLASPDMLEFMEDKMWFSVALSDLPERTTVVVALCSVEHAQFQESVGATYQEASSWKHYVLGNNQKDNIESVADMIGIIDIAEPDAPKPGPRAPRQPKMKIYPSKVYQPYEDVILAFTNEMKGTIQVSFNNDTKIDTHKLNPYTRKFKAPEKKPGNYTLHVYHDAKEIYHKVFRYIAPYEMAFTSITYIRQAFQCENEAALDRKLVDILQHSLPEDDSLSALFNILKTNIPAPQKGISEYPTLLHYAAAFGLSDFTSQLLDAPGSQTAFQILNDSGKDPADLAETNGHHELAEYIRDYMATAYVTDACELYMAMTKQEEYKNVESLQESESEENYMTMGPGSLCHVFQEEDDLEPESPYTLPRSIQAEPPPALHPRASKLPPVPKKALRKSSDAAPSYPAPPPPQSPKLTRVQSERIPATQSPPALSQRKGNTLPTGLTASMLMGMAESELDALPVTALGSSSQNELLEIMNGVKEGTFNLNEAIMVFKAWQQRNGDGQSRSFKERQATLKKMRDEYSAMISSVENEANQKKSGFFSRLISRRQKTTKHVPNITNPVPQRSPKRTGTASHHRTCDNPRSSSSSSSSRESSSSVSYEHDGSSDDSDSGHSGNVKFRPRVLSSTSSLEGDKRQSRKMEFLAIAEVREEQPPIPPRTYTRTDIPRPVPRHRPMQTPRK